MKRHFRIIIMFISLIFLNTLALADIGLDKTKNKGVMPHGTTNFSRPKVFQALPRAAMGDVKVDGKITIADALFIAQYAEGKRQLTTEQLQAADIDGNGRITKYDAILIANYLAGNLNSFEEAHKYGDISGDGTLDNNDIQLIYQHLIGNLTFNTTQGLAADMNSDNKITWDDYNLLIAYIQSSTVIMPTLPTSGATDVNGRITVNFILGALLPAQISGLWARVTYDNKTEFWNLGTGALSSDGKSLSLKFEPTLDGKTIKLELYGLDTSGRQTSFANPINITVDSDPSNISMPTLPVSSTTDVNGRITINFTSGILFANQLSDLWARVTYDNKAEFWDLDPNLLNADGKSITLQLGSQFDGKVLKIELYGFDLTGKQTGFSNPVNIAVNSGFSTIVMPQLPSTGSTDNNGRITINFTSGALFTSQLNSLWARVTYDNKIEFWSLPLGISASDGRSLTMQFSSSFRGKTLRLEFYGFDTSGKQTNFTNSIDISVL